MAPLFQTKIDSNPSFLRCGQDELRLILARWVRALWRSKNKDLRWDEYSTHALKRKQNFGQNQGDGRRLPARILTLKGVTRSPVGAVQSYSLFEASYITSTGSSKTKPTQVTKYLVVRQHIRQTILVPGLQPIYLATASPSLEAGRCQGATLAKVFSLPGDIKQPIGPGVGHHK